MNLSPKQLRGLILENLKPLRRVLVSSHQARIVRFITMQGDINAGVLAKFLGVEASCASSQLSELYRKGYLKRVASRAPQGWWGYTYSINDKD